MAKQIKLEMTKTYASEANAIKAVEKIYPAAGNDGLRYLVLQHTDGRFYPVFIGQDALANMIHFNFHVLA